MIFQLVLLGLKLTLKEIGEYREDTSYAFKYFMRAVKLDHEFASGFAYLGHFYREVQNDAVRAKKLYQKTFLLDPLQVDAAFHLSNYYVEDDEHEEAEAVFRQVTQLVPRLGWAWRRLGYANIVSIRNLEWCDTGTKHIR